MSQFHHKQNQGGDDAQLWQQQLMYKQMQELQRLPQLQQFHGARQQNSLNPLFATAKSAAFDQVPTMMNEMPINDPSSYTWSNNNVGELRSLNNSQMFTPGNMNWAHFGPLPSANNSLSGILLSNNQTQSLGSLGFVSQQLSQPFFNTMPGSTSGSVNHNSHFLGMSNDFMTKVGGNQIEEASVQSDSFNTFQNDHHYRERACLNDDVSNSLQNFHGKSHSRGASVQSPIGSVTSENSQQVNHLQSNIQLLGFHGKQIQGDWSGNSQEKFTAPVGAARSETYLDPTEQKLLFGTDENVNLGALFEMSAKPSTEAYAQGNHLESDGMGTFPSLQSGSWSALMQEALQASSSDNGVQEEWTALGLQQTDQSITKSSSNDNAKRTAAWDDNSLHNTSSLTLRPFAVHTNTDVPSFQYPFKPAHEHERVAPEFLRAPVPGQQSTEQGTSKNCYLNLKAKQSDECTFQEQMLFSDGNRVQQTHLQSHGNSYSDWISSKNMFAHNFSNESSAKPNGWKSNNHLPSSGEKPLSNVATHSWGDDNLERNHNQPIGGRQALESSRADAEWASYDSKHEHRNVVLNEGHILNSSDHGLHISSEFAARVDPLFPANDGRPPNTASQRSLGQQGQQTLSSQMFPDHSIGNIGMDAGPSFTRNPMMYSRVVQHSALQDSNDLEQRFVRHTQVAGNIALNKSLDVVEGTSIGEEGLKSKFDVPVLCSTGSSFDRSTAAYLPNQTGQTGPNMLELLHKVDTSRNNNTTIAVDVPEQVAFDVSTSRQHLAKPPLQGFGLQLAPSSQWQRVSSHSTSSLTFAHDPESKQLGNEDANKDLTQLPSASSIQSLPSTHSSSQGEDANNRSNMSEEVYKETSFLSHQMNLNASDSDYILKQQNYAVTGQRVNTKSLNTSFGSQSMVNAAYTKQTYESHDAFGDQSVQAALSGFSGRVPPFKLNSSPDNLVPASSQLCSAKTDCNGMLGADLSQTKSLGQQLPVTDTRPGSQPGSQSAVPGRFHQVGAVFKNVWTNISAQQCLSGLQPNKIPPSILQSMMLSNNSGGTRLRGLQKMDDQGKKGDNASEAGTSSTNSRNRDERQVSANSAEAASSGANVALNRGDSSQGPGEPLQKHILDGSSNVPISALVQVGQHDVGKVKHVGNLTADIQTANASFTNVVKPPDVQQHRYSLLHQMQALKHADYDPGNRFGNRPTGVDSSQMDLKAGQRFSYGQNNSLTVPTECKIGLTSESSFPTDDKMLSFASRNNEERSVPVSSQLSGKVASPHDMLDAQKHYIQPNSTSNLMERNEHAKISPQMAPTWFEQYGTYKNGQTVANDLQKTSCQQHNLKELSWSIDNARGQRTESSQLGIFGQNIASSKVADNELSCLPCNIMAPSMVMRSKKRKSSTSELSSWHKVIEGPQKLRSISITEIDWARATNRLMEKVEDEAEMLEDGPSLSQLRRRLILATQLAQQLLPAVPTASLRKQAALTYESMTYCVAKVALGDACSLIPCAGIDSHLDLDNEKIVPERISSEKLRNDIFPKVVEVFIGRFKKLENDFIRLKRTAMVDVQLECQEVERFSIVNRLGRFHGRSSADGLVFSSTFETAPRRLYAQRHVTPLSMPGNLPEGVPCLSL